MENLIETHVVKPKLSVFFNEEEYRLITTDDENNLDQKISQIGAFMAGNHGFGQPDEHKDKLYAQAQQLWRDYAESFRNVNYTFYLNRKQYKYLTSLLNEKLEYDVNTVFLAIELTNMLGTWHKSDKHENDNDIKGFTADATEVTYIYHLIAKHTVKGLSRDSYLFAEILRKIGDVSKIINFYDAEAKSLNAEIQKWVAEFEPQESTDNTQTIQAKTIKPKESKKLETANEE